MVHPEDVDSTKATWYTSRGYDLMLQRAGRCHGRFETGSASGRIHKKFLHRKVTELAFRAFITLSDERWTGDARNAPGRRVDAFQNLAIITIMAAKSGTVAAMPQQIHCHPNRR